MRKILFFAFISALLLTALTLHTKAQSIAQSTISISPQVIVPGDPVMITVNSNLIPVKILFDKKSVPFFIYNGKPTALIAIDLKTKVFKHTLKVVFLDGSVISNPVVITPQKQLSRTFNIVEKLG